VPAHLSLSGILNGRTPLLAARDLLHVGHDTTPTPTPVLHCIAPFLHFPTSQSWIYTTARVPAASCACCDQTYPRQVDKSEWEVWSDCDAGDYKSAVPCVLVAIAPVPSSIALWYSQLLHPDTLSTLSHLSLRLPCRDNPTMAPSADSPSPPPSPTTRPKILVPEKVSAEGLALLKTLYEVDTRTGLSAEEVLALIPSYHGLIVRSETKVTSEVLAAGHKLRVVARAGVGVDNIDVDAATKHGIIVVNSPAGNIVAAAEHTIALLLATARNVGRADASLKAGKWERSKLVGVEVGHKTLGIIGLGKVGMKVARMAIGLGMKVTALDPYASADVAKQAGVNLVGSLAELLPVVDFLTIHTPLLASTLNLLGEAELQKMRKTARVLNVARGGVYNEEALLKALDEGLIAGAGLDVFTSEPPAAESAAARLAVHPKVVSTPHLGASTVEAQENVSMDVCTQVLEILRGGLPTAAVNAPLILPEEYRRLQPFVKL